MCVNKLLTVNRGKRYTAQDLLSDPWMSSDAGSYLKGKVGDTLCLVLLVAGCCMQASCDLCVPLFDPRKWGGAMEGRNVCMGGHGAREGMTGGIT